MALDIELRVVDRSDLAVSVDHVGLTAAKQAKHVSFDVNLLADGVVLIHKEVHLRFRRLDGISPQIECILADANAFDKYGERSLVRAIAKKSDIEVVRLLLNHKAAANAPCKNSERPLKKQ